MSARLHQLLKNSRLRIARAVQAMPGTLRKPPRRLMAALASCALLALSLQVMRLAWASAPNFQNGSFEQLGIATPTGGYQFSGPDSTTVTGWTCGSGSSCEIDPAGAWTPSDGKLSMDMNGNLGPGAVVSQTFATAIGSSYTVHFDLAGNPVAGCGTAIKHLQVSAALASQTYTFDTTGKSPSYMGWTTQTLTFTAVGASTTLTFTGLDNPSSCGPTIDNVHVLTTLSGTVFEDKNYGGGAGRNKATALAGGGSARSGAHVELYDASGNYKGYATTDTNGAYSFTVDVANTYYIRVVQNTVSSARTGWGGALLGVQTYRTDASTGTVTDVTDHVGGENPALPDAYAWGYGGGTLSNITYSGYAVQSLTKVVLGDAPLSGIDFGYNWDTIVNTNTNGQGSLYQWAFNQYYFSDQATMAQSGSRLTGGVTSALPAGYETSIFMIPNGNSAPGLRAGLTNQLTSGGYAAIHPGGTILLNHYSVLDGATQTANVGDTNAGQVGTGGTVGTSGTVLPLFDKPEIEIDGFGCDTIYPQSTYSAVRSIALSYGSIYVTGSYAQISDMLIAMDATGSSNASSVTACWAIHPAWASSSNLTIHHNYVRASDVGLYLESGAAANSLIEYNEIAVSYTGANATTDGMVLWGTTGLTVQYNLVRNHPGAGIELPGGGLNGGLIQENTVTSNGLLFGTSTASNEPGGIVIYPSASPSPITVVKRNVITGNAGDGIAVLYAWGTGGYTISQNAIYNNNVGTTNGIGIDLNHTSADPNNFQWALNGVTTNTGSYNWFWPNNGMNYPVISSGSAVGSALAVAGYVGSGANQSTFGNAKVEIFLSSNAGSGYGDGQTYLGTLTAGSNGNFSGTITVPTAVTLASGNRLTATATDSSGNTSEFGPNFNLTNVVPAPPSGFNAFESSTASGLVTGVIQTKQSKAWFGLDIVAINASGGVYTGFTGTVTVAILDASNTTGTVGANGCNPNWVQISGSGAPSGTLPATFAAANAGRVSTGTGLIVSDAYRNLRVQISYTNSQGVTVTSCSTDNFAMNPYPGTPVVTDADWATAGTTRTLNNGAATGGVVHKAGQPFRLSANATNQWGYATTNYNGTVTALLTCLLPSGCGSSDLGTLAFTGTYTAGVLSTTATYSEAGVFNLQLVDTTWAAVDAADTPASQRYTYSNTITVGRFVPDHFAVAVTSNGSMYTYGSGSCATRAFSYLGQAIPYKTVPVVSVTAQNASGATTRNYRNELWKLTSGAMLQSYYDAGANNPLNIGMGTATVTATGYGVGTMSPNAADTVTWVRSTTAPQSPFNAQAVDIVSAVDNTDSAVNGLIVSAAAAYIQPAFDAGASMRYGRISLGNAYGIETQSLAVPVEAQYWNGSTWVTNTSDSCTSIPASAFTMGNWNNNLSACKTSLGSSSALTLGRASVVLSAPGTGNAGTVDLGLNVGSTASGSVCINGASTASTALGLTYLQGAWTGGSWTANPVARESFGTFGLVPGFRREN